MPQNRIQNLYSKLLERYGRPEGQWKLWCKRPKTAAEKERILIESILTQRANWRNVELAMGNLRSAGICRLARVCEICESDKAKLSALIRPSGFYAQKSEYLSVLAKFVCENYGKIKAMQKEPLEKLRAELLAVKGIGPETADSILLYALEKPAFVMDEYTRRLARAKNLAHDLSYNALQKLFQESVERNYRLYQDFHALIVIDGKAQRENSAKLNVKTA